MTIGIGQLHESSLHAALKSWYAQPGDLPEVLVGSHVVDLLRGETLIEVQTGNFTSIGRKIRKLIDAYPIKVLYPIAVQKWIAKYDQNGALLERRKSPKTGKLYEVFGELVRIPDLLPHPNFSLEVLLTLQEEIRVNDGRGSWRRKGWSIADRKLLEVQNCISLPYPTGYLALLPEDLKQPFSNQALAKQLGIRLNLAQKMTYTLRACGLLEISAKKGNAFLFSIASMD